MSEELPSIPMFRDLVESFASLPALEEVEPAINDSGSIRPVSRSDGGWKMRKSIQEYFVSLWWNDAAKAHETGTQLVCQLCATLWWNLQVQDSCQSSHLPDHQRWYKASRGPFTASSLAISPPPSSSQNNATMEMGKGIKKAEAGARGEEAAKDATYG